MQPLPESPAGSPVTDAQRAYIIELLGSTRTALHNAVAGLSASQITAKPDPARWSVLDCVEHVVLVEAYIFGQIKQGMDAPADPDRRAQIQVSDVNVVKAVRSRMTPVVAPAPVVPTGRFGTGAEALAAFDAGRDAVVAWAETATTDLRTHYFVHFRLGTLDAYQALLVLASHGERHRKQIEEIRASVVL